MTCKHKFVYGGVKYTDDKYPMAGTGAHRRIYHDWFYCEKCLENQYFQLDAESTTYEKPFFNATPTGNGRTR